MIANLHVLTRAGLDVARTAFPDPLIDVEHRGDGDCAVDAGGVVATVAALLGVGLASLGEGESLWIRSSATDPSTLAVDVRWRGREADLSRLAEATRIAEEAGGGVVRDAPAGEHHLGFRLPRTR